MHERVTRRNRLLPSPGSHIFARRQQYGVLCKHRLRHANGLAVPTMVCLWSCTVIVSTDFADVVLCSTSPCCARVRRSSCTEHTLLRQVYPPRSRIVALSMARRQLIWRISCTFRLTMHDTKGATSFRPATGKAEAYDHRGGAPSHYHTELGQNCRSQ